MQDLYQVFYKLILVLLAFSLVITSARHLGEDGIEDSNQITEIESNQLGPGIKPALMEILLAQKLSELQSNNQPRYPEYINNYRLNIPQDYIVSDVLEYPGGYQRSLRNSNKGANNGKRGSRCFFNAVSCFGKK